MTTFDVDVISDFTCVWCFVGKRKLEQAISLYRKTYPAGKEDVFNLTWRPYYLNHHLLPEGSVDKAELRAKLGKTDPTKQDASYKRLDQVGKSLGISFNHEGKIGSTREAHRLVHLTQSRHPEITPVLVENLFQAHHELAIDISSKKELREIAIKSGIEPAEVDNWLSSIEGQGEVDEAAKRTMREGKYAGVPQYVFQGEKHIDGAQDDFFDTFISIKEGRD